MTTTRYGVEQDLIVIGGGPAGMMAAGHAGESGAKVLLVEKTYRLGSKLLMTGGGRCNITNTADMKEFISAFGKNGKFLFRALSIFSNQDLIRFLSVRGVETRNDPDGKVFPANDSAESVLAAMRAYLEENNVCILHNTAVTGIVTMSEKHATVSGVTTEGDGLLHARKVIVATGGMSYPKTGSSGDGYALARQCGHTLVPPMPGLIPLESDESFIKELQGLTLKDILISVVVNGKSKAGEKGDLLFTHFGVSGPTVLILSGIVVDRLAEGGDVSLSLQLRPSVGPAEFDRFLQKEFESRGQKTFFGYLKETLPVSFARVFERRSGVKQNQLCCSIRREERKRVAALFTDFRIHITRPRPIEEAIVTRGGVALEEIDPRTMESRLVRGLFFCGEVIDIDGITGGYNLQGAFSTGYLAGEKAGR
jgi:predicted Rossmann fold flavoprotein